VEISECPGMKNFSMRCDVTLFSGIWKHHVSNMKLLALYPVWSCWPYLISSDPLQATCWGCCHRSAVCVVVPGISHMYFPERTLFFVCCRGSGRGVRDQKWVGIHKQSMKLGEHE
jgi:hypothetical protein